MPAKGVGTVDRSTPGRLCACGCGHPVPHRDHHRYVGTPAFIHGHNSRTLAMRSGAAERIKRLQGVKKARILRHGYWYIYRPDHPHTTKQGYVAEHRLVAEQELGRLLDPTEVVHHVNGNPLDNRPENLSVKSSQAEHLKHHAGHVLYRIEVEGLFYNRHSKRWEPRLRNGAGSTVRVLS